MERFIIGGLPRSGTAWIANFLSLHDGVFCWHEAIQYGKRFGTYTEAIDSPLRSGAVVVGDSTTGIMENFDAVQAKRFFIVRNPDACKQSYRKCLGKVVDREWDSIYRNALRWMNLHNPVKILFDDIFSKNMDMARRACRYLLEETAGVPWNEDIFQLAYETEVQIFGLSEEHYDNKEIIALP
jgi:hypothetical protein